MRSRYVKTLSPGQLVACQQDSHELWGGALSLDKRLARLRSRLAHEEGAVLSMRGLVEEHDALLASLKFYTLELCHGGAFFPTLGIGALFTSPSARGKGCASVLLHNALAEAKDSGYQAALLFSDIGTAYYHRFGFAECSAHDYSAAVRELPASQKPVEARLATDADIDHLRSAYLAAQSDATLFPSRKKALWPYFREQNGPVEDWLFHFGREETAYLSLKRGADQEIIWLNELVAPSESHEALLSWLKHYCDERNIKRVLSRQPLPGVAWSLEVRTKEIPMVASLSPQFELAKLDRSKSWFGVLDQF